MELLKIVVEKIDIHYHGATEEQLRSIHDQLKAIAMNQAELAQALADIKTQADKAKAEIVAAVQALTDALANAGSTTPEVDAALAALQGSVQGLDDLNPDGAAP